MEAPREWVRFQHGKPQPMEGRWCDRVQPWTSRRSCSSCPAYRGMSTHGMVVTGLAPNGDPHGLSAAEYALYTKAVEATYDDDFTLFRAFLDLMEEGVGERTQREHGDPDAQGRWAAYMQGYRQRMSDEQKERTKLTKREYMRQYMRNRRKFKGTRIAALVSVSSHESREPG